MPDRNLSRRQLLQAGAGTALSVVLSRSGFPILQAQKSTLRIYFDELPDLYCYLRWGSSNSAKLGAAWQPALKEMAKASEAQNGRFAFAAIDGLIADSGSLALIEELVPDLPEVGPGGVALREPLSRVVAAVKLAQPLYEAERVAAHRKTFADAMARVKTDFQPRERDTLDFLLRGLKVVDRGKDVPVLLVVEAPSPAGFTVRSRKSGAVCFVGMREHAGTLLFETILHEATHAFDLAVGTDSNSVLGQLRDRLAKAKVAADDPLMRNLPHTLFFVHAGAVVRRHIDPKHKDYGEVTGLYKRSAQTSEPVLKHWHSHLDGKCTSDEAVERIVADVLKTA